MNGWRRLFLASTPPWCFPPNPRTLVRASERQAPQKLPELDSMGSPGKQVGAAVGSVRGARAVGQREGGTSRGLICGMLV